MTSYRVGPLSKAVLLTSMTRRAPSRRAMSASAEPRTVAVTDRTGLRGQLHGEPADPTGATMHEYVVPRA